MNCMVALLWCSTVELTDPASSVVTVYIAAFGKDQLPYCFISKMLFMYILFTYLSLMLSVLWQ